MSSYKRRRTRRTLWTTPANPDHKGLDDLNPRGDSVDVAKKLEESSVRDLGFGTPVTAETLMRSTGGPSIWDSPTYRRKAPRKA